MASVDLYRKPLRTSVYRLSAFICHTPKTFVTDTDRNCQIVTSESQLFEEFGNPYICPKKYTDLILAHKMIVQGLPVCISSVNDVKCYDDGFLTSYNGYTELIIKSKNSSDEFYNFARLKMKSEVKFCQPYFYCDTDGNTLNIHLQTYLLDRSLLPHNYVQNTLYRSTLVDQVDLSFNTLSSTDQSIINAFSNYGIELKIEYLTTNKNVMYILKSYKEFTPTPKELSPEGMDPTYSLDPYAIDLHDQLYAYDFDNITALHTYTEAADKLVALQTPPYFITVCKAMQSFERYSADNKLLYTDITNAPPENCWYIYTELIKSVPASSGIYLFINMPDTSVHTALSLLRQENDYTAVDELPESHNCDLFFGYIPSRVKCSLLSGIYQTIYYTAASLIMYNLITNADSIYQTYKPLGMSELGLSYQSPKSYINDSTANQLVNNRCNSVVTFDLGKTWIFGNRSLSNNQYLQHSHIARSVVYIRRIISEYLETVKFNINNALNVQSYINYINSIIIQPFIDGGLLRRSASSFEIDGKSVTITVPLNFNNVVNSINLNFSI